MLFQLLISLPLLISASFDLRFSTHHPVHSVKWISRGGGSICDVIAMGPATHRLAFLSHETIVSITPLIREIDPVDDGHIHDHAHPSEDDEILITAYARSENSIMSTMKSRCGTINPLPQEQNQSVEEDIVRELVKSGDPSNRIDVVLMGDGYLEKDLARMESDMMRLTNDMFNGETFQAYLPVFNIWSVFRASAEEGIGTGGKPKDTAFGLYRDGTELRGIYCSKAAAAREACRSTGPNACDYPSLIGNDPYYGGLGGEFTISTQSPTSGTLVLRHEMGHNFINVGEEYDGGSVYRGVNFVATRDVANLPWIQWANMPYNQTEDAEIRVQDYAWYDLAGGNYVINFTTDGTYARWFMRYSVSGCETQNAISITLDGQQIPWTTHNSLDRFLEEVFSPNPLSAGTHQLIFRQLTPPAPGNPIRQLCSVTLHEYKAEPQFHLDNNYVGAYPTWRQGKILAGYRPTNEFCIMRNMSSTRFCSPCSEGMWLRFFAVVSAIDDVHVVCDVNDINFHVETVKLGQLREGGAEPGEYFQVRWYWNNDLQDQFNDLFDFKAPKSFYGSWRVEVNYVTPLVRSDPNGLLHFVESFEVPLCH